MALSGVGAVLAASPRSTPPRLLPAPGRSGSGTIPRHSAAPMHVMPLTLTLPANVVPAATLRLRRSLAARASSTSVAVKEAATGVAFPTTFTAPGASQVLSLLGTGVREKSFAIIAVKVYAVAFYIDLASTPTPWKGKPEVELQSDRTFFDSLAEAPSDKSLILTLVRDVTSQQFVNALSEELAPKLKAIGADLSIIDQLTSLFQGRPLKKSSAVLLTWKQPDSLLVSFVDDVSEGYNSGTTPHIITSIPLLRALFDIFLGADPVSPSLAQNIASSAAGI